MSSSTRPSAAATSWWPGVVLLEDLDVVRRVPRGLVLPGQRRLHMKDESDPRKRSTATAISVSDVQATIYDAGRRHRNERERRAACLRAIVEDGARRGDATLVLEQDDSLVSWDNQHLIEFIRAAGCRDTLCYEHRRAAADLALAIPDAIAWCWAKGGDWRRRIEPIVTNIPRGLSTPDKREARAPRSSGRVSGSLPEAQRNGLNRCRAPEVAS